MKIYEFLILNDELQYQMVWDKGVFTEQVISSTIVYQLYTINDFYVEIQYEHVSNKIIRKQVFKQGVHLEKYLKAIPKEI